MPFGEPLCRGTGGPVILYLKSEHGNLAHLAECLDALLPETAAYTIRPYTAPDWDADYSPWAMPPRFAGRGEATLREVLTAVDDRETYIAGYSLAGLFALWAFYRTGRFRGAACCSGSLWFSGWDEFADAAHAPRDSLVYLSLGGKEPKAPDPVLASIGEAYSRQEKRCAADESIRRSVYEMNPGGHFADPDKRLAKGIAWLLKNR